MKKIFLLASLALALTACDDILDITPKDRLSEDVVWSDESLIKAYHSNLYTCLPHGFCANMQSKATDEVYNAKSGGIEIIALGTLTPDNVTNLRSTEWHGGGNLYVWDSAFQNIRKINIFLEKMETIDITDKERLVAEAKFLRAYIYFMLIARFGEAPIVTQSYEMGTDVKFTSNSFDECVKFIEDNIPNMPLPTPTLAGQPRRLVRLCCRELIFTPLLLFSTRPTTGQNGRRHRRQPRPLSTPTSSLIFIRTTSLASTSRAERTIRRLSSQETLRRPTDTRLR